MGLENLENLENHLTEANDAYRAGNPIMSDAEYDAGLDALALNAPDAPLLSTVGTTAIDPTRKVALLMVMASMNKVKTYDELVRWMRLKNIPNNALLVITPKFDGISLCADERSGVAVQRGDNEFGQLSSDHYALVGNRFKGDDVITNGEVLFPRSVFDEKYAAAYENARNTVGGKFNKKEAPPMLADAVYIRYGTSGLVGGSKVAELEYLNARQSIQVPFVTCYLSELSDVRLVEIYRDFRSDYELDGLIIEVNDGDLRARLGRETSTQNPAYARAYKGEFEEVKQSVVTGITWTITKQGLVKPVIQIEPVKLDGATVTNITGKNARNIKVLGIGAGAIVKVMRSGMVIPEIKEVVEKVEFQMPEIAGVEIKWSASGIELQTGEETDEQRFKQLAAFFEILGIENVSEGIFRQLWDEGYRTVKQILELTVSDLARLDNFRSRRAQNVYDAIRKSVKDVSLSKLQHASGFFKTLGSRKLALLEHFTEKPQIGDIVKIDGFAETSAAEFIKGYDKFFAFISDLPITVAQEQASAAATQSSELLDKSFVFTGIRRADLEAVIVSKGGKIGSGVSKNTDFLVVKELGSGSSKAQKAEALGVKVISCDELETMLS